MTEQISTKTETGRTSHIGAGQVSVAGGSGGLLLWLIETYGPDGNTEMLLTCLVPTVTLVISGVYSIILDFCKGWVASAFAARAERDLLARSKESLTRLREQLELIENDPQSSQKHLRVARARLEEAQLMDLDLSMKGVVDPPDIGGRSG